MTKSIQTRVYKKLIDDITALYDVARHALVEAYWQIGKRIVIQTYKTDKYAHYLADVFYLPGCHKYEKITGQGHFLNQELLDKGLAQPWKS